MADIRPKPPMSANLRSRLSERLFGYLKRGFLAEDKVGGPTRQLGTERVTRTGHGRPEHRSQLQREGPTNGLVEPRYVDIGHADNRGIHTSCHLQQRPKSRVPPR